MDQAALKAVLSAAFQQRRKMLRQSLKSMLRPGQTLPEEFATRRPGEVSLSFCLRDPVCFVAWDATESARGCPEGGVSMVVSLSA